MKSSKAKRQTDKDDEQRIGGYTNNLAELESDEEDEDEEVEIVDNPPIKTKEKKGDKKEEKPSKEKKTATAKTAKTGSSSAAAIDVDNNDEEEDDEGEEEEEETADKELAGRRQTRSCAGCKAKTNITTWWGYKDGDKMSFTGGSAPMTGVYCGDCKTAGKMPGSARK
jgi:hypothetical protein